MWYRNPSGLPGALKKKMYASPSTRPGTAIGIIASSWNAVRPARKPRPFSVSHAPVNTTTVPASAVHDASRIEFQYASQPPPSIRSNA